MSNGKSLRSSSNSDKHICIPVSAGITQRTVRTPGAGAGTAAGRGPDGAFGHGAYPCFHAMPESQPVLPCLLRRLLQKGKADAAAALAARHSRCANR